MSEEKNLGVNPPKQSNEISPVMAVEGIFNELSKIATFLNAAKQCHGLDTSNIQPSFSACDNLLHSLHEWETKQAEIQAKIQEQMKNKQEEKLPGRPATEKELARGESKTGQIGESVSTNTEIPQTTRD